MHKIIDQALSYYSHSDIDLKLKAKFFLGICLFNLAVIPIIILVYLYVHKFGFQTDKNILSILIFSFFMIASAFVLLIKGQFSVSAHMNIIVDMVAVWAIILIDQSHPISRLDTIVYIICILSLLPLVVNRIKSIILFYGGINILLLFGFFYFFHSEISVPYYNFIEFISDNTIVIFITSIIAYSTFTINRTALDRAKAEIEERKQAENTIQIQKEKLEIINKELSFSLDQIAKTAIELEKKNDLLKVIQSKLLSSNSLLRESEEKFSKAFHLSPLIICLLSLPRGQFVDISDSFCALLGCSSEDIIGRTSTELKLWPNETDLQNIKDVITSGKNLLNVEINIQSQTKNKKTIIISSEILPIALKPHLIIVGVDITERKRSEIEKTQLEEQLRQAQKMEVVGHFVGGIAHDFNNMLSAVIGNSELMLMSNRLDPSSLKRLNTIHDTALRTADLVRQLLAFARKQTIRPQYLDINKTITGMIKILQRIIGEDIQLKWVPGKDIGKILIDPSQIDQILANLMVNARDAISGVGKVTIKTHQIVIDESHCSRTITQGFLSGPYVVLSISDNGCGIEKNTLNQIFEPFFTTKEVGKGTGLGLSTVYGIVKQNDGYIHVKSQPNIGTTFWIYLPLITTDDIRIDTDASTKITLKGSETILMVEDDLAILDIGKTILEQLGYNVITANEPMAAIKIAYSYEKQIDLLFTDIVMPQMNGRDLARYIGEIIPGIRCLYMSGYTANIIAHHGIIEKGVNFLHKPFSIKNLAEKIREISSTPQSGLTH